MIRTPRLVLILSAAAAAASLCGQSQQRFRFAREDVLGTSSVLVVEASDEGLAQHAEKLVYDEVARLAGIYSTHDEAGELARLVAAGGGRPSAELAAMLTEVVRWREVSGGRFEPGVGVLTRLWEDAAKRGVAPGGDQLAAAVRDTAAAFRFVGGEVVAKGPVTVDALAKGMVVDRAAAALQKLEGVRLVSFQIGGDLRVGAAPVEVELTDPRASADNAAPLRKVRVTAGGLASSGGYRRGFDVAGVHHSHILDPRTGMPCDQVLGASVIADDTATADVLATLMCVLGPADGFVLLAKVPHAHAVVTTADGEVHASDGFAAFVVESGAGTSAAASASAGGDDGRYWPKGFELRVDFEIKAPANSSGRQRGGWRRPYVAVWIEDVTGAPARTLCLWVESLRYLRELHRWSRHFGDDDGYIDLHSQATRKAGAYHLVWDGTDDDGRRLVAGRYFVCIEVTREHGTYQLIRKEVDLQREPVTVDLEANDELAGAKLVFGADAGKVAR